MKNIGMLVGLLCFAVGHASSQNFKLEKIPLEAQELVGAAQKAGEVAAAAREQVSAQGCGDGCGSPLFNAADALNEAKVGIAAKFVSVKPGEFEMGSPADETFRESDEAQHAVKLTKGYEMQATAVTQLQYFLVMGRNPSTFRNEKDCDSNNYKVLYGAGLCANHPVENVSWDDAQKFIESLNNSQNKYTYGLPTEAQWEYAARAGMPSGFPYSFGFNDTNELNNYAWYDGNSGGRTHAVATKKANQCGLYDMNGNVWQWTQDWYGDYAKGIVTDPTGSSTGSLRVIRGGSWDNVASYLRSASRISGDPGYRGSYVGFRLVRSSR